MHCGSVNSLRASELYLLNKYSAQHPSCLGASTSARGKLWHRVGRRQEPRKSLPPSDATAIWLQRGSWTAESRTAWACRPRRSFVRRGTDLHPLEHRDACRYQDAKVWRPRQVRSPDLSAASRCVGRATGELSGLVIATSLVTNQSLPARMCATMPCYLNVVDAWCTTAAHTSRATWA